MGVFVVVMVYYVPAGLFYELQIRTDNSTYGTFEVCYFVNTDAVLIVSYMDLGMRVIAPFILMLTISLLLSYSLFASRLVHKK